MVSRAQFLNEFGNAIRARRAAVFIGAGMSVPSGLPSWDNLMAPLREQANVPEAVGDPTLVAEYAVQELSSDYVERLLLNQFDQATASATDALKELLTVDLAEIWTTNFDTLIEDQESFDVIISDDDYMKRSSTTARRLTKLHGSLGVTATGELKWRDSPVFTRSDFETFEQRHPLKWAMLRAQFLTSSFLFLGFSFADPNAHALLRIVRSLPPKIRRMPHFAIMHRPSGETTDARQFDLFSRDLANAGINVVTVDDFDELPPLLHRLGRSSLPPNIFVSGDGNGGSSVDEVLRSLGPALTALPSLNLLSFDGPAARVVANEYKASAPYTDYQPERIRSYFRKSPTSDSQIQVARSGTAVFTELELPEMREFVYKKIRALLLVGEGTRAKEEAELAIYEGIPVVPIAMSGIVARDIWCLGQSTCGFPDPADEDDWKMLDSANPAVAVQAAVRLIKTVISPAPASS